MSEGALVSDRERKQGEKKETIGVRNGQSRVVAEKDSGKKKTATG